jgi:hypothetical protein
MASSGGHMTDKFSEDLAAIVVAAAPPNPQNRADTSWAGTREPEAAPRAARKKRISRKKKFGLVVAVIAGASGLLIDADTLYDNRVVAVGTQFNRDFSANVIESGVTRKVVARDGLGIPVEFEMKYLVGLGRVNTPRGDQLATTVEITPTGLLGQLMSIKRPPLETIWRAAPPAAPQPKPAPLKP